MNCAQNRNCQHGGIYHNRPDRNGIGISRAKAATAYLEITARRHEVNSKKCRENQYADIKGTRATCPCQ